MLRLVPIKRTNPGLLANMALHYSHPKGFVGRNICYAQQTKGYTCKRVGLTERLDIAPTDNWSGKRVWNTTELRPKRVFYKWSDEALKAMKNAEAA